MKWIYLQLSILQFGSIGQEVNDLADNFLCRQQFNDLDIERVSQLTGSIERCAIEKNTALVVTQTGADNSISGAIHLRYIHHSLLRNNRQEN